MFPFLILVGTLLFAISENAHSQDASAETVILKQRLATILREKAQLEQEQEASVRIAVQPYREYLLLQKSLDFADLSARLDLLEKEGEKVARRLAQREPVEASTLEAITDPPPRAFPTFSGAPPLSFNESSRTDEVLFYRPAWAPFLRLVLFAALFLIVIFPLMALLEMTLPRRARLAPVIPISSVKKRKGPDQETPKKKAA
jgi:hypothetical protein